MTGLPEGTRDVTVSGVKAAGVVGTCNGCDDQVTSAGVRHGATVFELQFKTSGIRLCRRCLRSLRAQLPGIS